ncbi:MAG: thiamine-phosphate kinase [Alphaproteobacteria bacterium]|nr:thiamine-phosphate kinase [Alphaproteobacteria bacterium]MBT4017849.1 thiamine-phosphate kinase [Alphaproteobacteria bacterium]MBT4965200.1 thiamine-phosphate kinase [Alphaproteobacteria bacterium]MBT5159685.1 thiamine-phosphate kinase [Alphaproteobacteria bacterium]MBT6384579.1 thiamine-phosphate kinase [Alphaproteobacteria bacterium]
MARRGEFDLIADLFSPLASSIPGALGLTDDAAILDLPAGCELVTTVDAMVEDVHFYPADAANLVAQKLLRVNLSDLAAMGAKPLGYLLTLVRPATTSESWLQRFAHGLAADQRTFGIGLCGGDTVSTAGPLVLSLTALGHVAKGQALRRQGAMPGDILYVSGTIGDAGLGLELVRNNDTHDTSGDLTGLSRAETNELVARLQCPEPRLALGQALVGIATSAVDISDGLIGDLEHIALVSCVGLELDLSAIPASDAAVRVIGNKETAKLKLLTGGEDYELAFTAPASETKTISDISRKLNLALTPIGKVVSGGSVDVKGKDGTLLPVINRGFSHF